MNAVTAGSKSDMGNLLAGCWTVVTMSLDRAGKVGFQPGNLRVPATPAMRADVTFTNRFRFTVHRNSKGFDARCLVIR
ncbi:hypothetical protein Nans01_16460 [Nocardiopsis ansamitocini]|uniref:Uncharacterized protein n=1 Tax=Nocardiopsis ansamitocini TaxID=1670832 RepID=A0A9W6P4Y5_9ACTN|nr:hypothetical protein Nans01_16460 [Nocardiopsis ansamitocini]